MSWTPERSDRLRELVKQGLSARQIAQQLGGVTRSAVIGRANRLGLSWREKPSAPKAIRSANDLRPHNGAANRARANAKIARPKNPQPPHILGAGHTPGIKPPTMVEMPKGRAGGYAAPLTELGAHQCRWPLGKMLDPVHLFCGEPLGEDRDMSKAPYCPAHAKRAVNPNQPKKKSRGDLARSLRKFL